MIPTSSRLAWRRAAWRAIGSDEIASYARDLADAKRTAVRYLAHTARSAHERLAIVGLAERMGFALEVRA